MGSIRRARILLKACLGQLLANAPVQSQGEAWLTMARCEIAEVSLDEARGAGGGKGEVATDEEVGDRGRGGGAVAGATASTGAAGAGRGKALTRAVLFLDRAVTMLKRCHDFHGLRECWYLKVGSVQSQGMSRPLQIADRVSSNLTSKATPHVALSRHVASS